MVHILNMTIYGSVAVIAVMILRLVFAKVPKKVTVWFWTVAFIRLICPYNFGSAFSIFRLKSVELTQIREQVNTAKDLAEPLVSETVLATGGSGAVAENLTDLTTASSPVRETINPYDLFFVIWITGVILLAGIMIFRSLKLMNRPGIRLSGGSGIIESEDINSSFVIGLIKPRICIPSYLSETEKEYIITHEKAHIKNRDQIIKLLLFAVLCLHWFNPLVWIMYILVSADMEMRCDEEVIDKLGNKARKEYCVSMVLHASEGYKHIGILDSTFAKKTIGGIEIKMRIMNLVKYKKMPAAAAALCLVFAFGTSWALSSAASDISGTKYGYSTDLTPDAKPSGINARKLSDKEKYLKEVRALENKTVKDPKDKYIMDYGEKGGFYIKEGAEDQLLSYDEDKAVIPDVPAQDLSGLAKRFNDDKHKIVEYKYTRDVDTDYIPALWLEIQHKDVPLRTNVSYFKTTYASYDEFVKDTQSDVDEVGSSRLREEKYLQTDFGYSKIVYDPFQDLEIERVNYYSDLDIREKIENYIFKDAKDLLPVIQDKEGLAVLEYSLSRGGNNLIFAYDKLSDVDYLPLCYMINQIDYKDLTDFEDKMNKIFIDKDGSYKLLKEIENGLGSCYNKFVTEYEFSSDNFFALSGEQVDKINDRLMKYNRRGSIDIENASVTSKAYTTDKGYRIDFRDSKGNILAYVTYDIEYEYLSVYNLI